MEYSQTLAIASDGAEPLETVMGFLESPVDNLPHHSDGDDARQRAERVHQFLLASTKPAVLIARDWHVFGIPFAFEDLTYYQEVAARSNCFIVTIAQAVDGGLEHLFFIAQTKGLTKKEYLACIDESGLGCGIILSIFRDRSSA